MYNREMGTAAKMVSYGTTNLLRNGLNSVHMSLTELKDSDLISRSVYMCFKCSGCVFTRNFFCFVIKSESIRNGSKVRPVPLPFIPLATLEVPKLHRTPEIHFAVTMWSAPHKTEFLQ